MAAVPLLVKLYYIADRMGYSTQTTGRPVPVEMPEWLLTFAAYFCRQVTHVWHNMTIRERPGLRPNGCFYTGTVRGDPHSTVAVSLCHGMVSIVFDVPGYKGRPRR
jgi:hypothetical protein